MNTRIIKNRPHVRARVRGGSFHAGAIFQVVEVFEENRQICFYGCQGLHDNQLRVYFRPEEIAFFETELSLGD